MEYEIKISVISLQSVRVVLLPYGVFCGRPQKKTRQMTSTTRQSKCVKKYSNTYPGRSYTNFSVNGVSVDSECVCTSLWDFLGGNKSHFVVMDTNHNVKKRLICYEVGISRDRKFTAWVVEHSRFTCSVYIMRDFIIYTASSF